MGKGDRGLILHDLDRLWRGGVAPSGDGELLERFRSTGDEAAFEALMDRHGPMVRGVCLRLLRDGHDADDAFQATFLVLARKGTGLRDPDRLGPWLFGVASRVAAKARVRNARRRGRPLPDDLPAREDPRAEWSDVRPILDAELARLPAPQRDVLVLCLLGGASEQEASRRLACPVGTVKSRLSRARESLRGRLVKRGVAPATALAAASSVESFASPVPSTLLRATLATISAQSPIPPAVAVLTQGVAPTMLVKTTLAALALAGGVGLLGLTATAWTQGPPTAKDAPPAGRKPEGEPVASAVETERNLREILRVMHNFYDSNGIFPTAAIRDAEGRPLLSWRVAVLPYFGPEELGLYNEFHLDEPWDSPHNKALIPRMPRYFETPGLATPPGQTRIRGYSGPDAMFGPELGPETALGVRFEDMRDGAGHTAFLAVAAEPTVWTRPGELPVGPGRSYGKPDASDPRGYVFAMVDGSIRHFAPVPERDAFVLAALSRSGGELIPWEVAAPGEPRRAAEADSRPNPTAPLDAAAAPAAESTPKDRAQLDRHLRTILLALHNYVAANGGFPPPAVLSPDGRPLLSWRVSILPYLGGQELYDQFHLDEPWDGPHNRELIARMPEVFQTPGLPASAGETRIRGVEAPGAIFGSHANAPPGGKIAFEDVTDGTSVTVALVVAQESVAWTRPGEMTKLLREVGSIQDGKATFHTEDFWPLMDDGADGYILGMVDGKVRRIFTSLQHSLFPGLFTYAGGEVINLKLLTPPPFPDPSTPTTAPRDPEDADRRLRRVEEKLDAILERLDAAKP